MPDADLELPYEKAGFEIVELSGNTYTVRKKLIL